eukprot:scaffold7723_cov100-Isochrysis_galbana.AAC.7
MAGPTGPTRRRRRTGLSAEGRRVSLAPTGLWRGRPARRPRRRRRRPRRRQLRHRTGRTGRSQRRILHPRRHLGRSRYRPPTWRAWLLSGRRRRRQRSWTPPRRLGTTSRPCGKRRRQRRRRQSLGWRRKPERMGPMRSCRRVRRRPAKTRQLFRRRPCPAATGGAVRRPQGGGNGWSACGAARAPARQPVWGFGGGNCCAIRHGHQGRAEPPRRAAHLYLGLQACHRLSLRCQFPPALLHHPAGEWLQIQIAAVLCVELVAIGRNQLQIRQEGGGGSVLATVATDEHGVQVHRPGNVPGVSRDGLDDWHDKGTKLGHGAKGVGTGLEDVVQLHHWVTGAAAGSSPLVALELVPPLGLLVTPAL